MMQLRFLSLSSSGFARFTSHPAPILLCALIGWLSWACGSDVRNAAGEGPAANGPQGTYLLTESVGFEPVAQSTVRVAFVDDEFGFSAGCNAHGGPYKVVDGKLVTNGLDSTSIDCDLGLQDQEQWLVQFFMSRPTLSVDGYVLTIAGEEATLTFLDREVADPDRPLVGTSWHIDSLFEGEFATGGEGHQADLIFNEDSTFTVEGPCNVISGTFEHGEGTITVGQSITTDASCEDSIEAKFEQHLMALFSPGENTYSITANRLRLERGNSGVYALSSN